MKKYYVYILTNKSNTLYIGITNNISRHLYEHKSKLVKGFTEKYNIARLIYFEEYASTIIEVVTREKQIKGWTRQKRINLNRLTQNLMN